MSIPSELLERIWFYTNFSCNLRCSYCVLGESSESQRPPLELSVFRRLVDQAVALGFRQAALTGGEPFIHPDIAAMLEHATARIDTVVLTNATVLPPALLDSLARLDRSRLTIQVSLNDANPRQNDEWRGAGSWQRAWQGLELLLKAGYRVAVRATLDGPDEASLTVLKESLVPLGVPEERIYGVPVAKVGRASHGVELRRAKVWPEPTIVGDGLYWYPLLIAPSDVVVPWVEPLESALEVLAEMYRRVKPVRLREVR